MVKRIRKSGRRRATHSSGVNEAEGAATKFTALFTEFLKAPEVTKRRLHLETMRSIIPKMGKKIILDSDAKQILPLLQIAPDNK